MWFMNILGTKRTQTKQMRLTKTYHLSVWIKQVICYGVAILDKDIIL